MLCWFIEIFLGGKSFLCVGGLGWDYWCSRLIIFHGDPMSYAIWLLVEGFSFSFAFMGMFPGDMLL